MNLCYCNKTINDVYYQGCQVNTIYYQGEKVYEKPKGCFYVSINASGTSEFCHTSTALYTCNSLSYSVYFYNLTNRPIYLSAETSSCTQNYDLYPNYSSDLGNTVVGRACTWVGWGGGACTSRSQQIYLRRGTPYDYYKSCCIAKCLIQPGKCLIFYNCVCAMDCRCATNFNIYFDCYCGVYDTRRNDSVKDAVVSCGYWNNCSIDSANFSIYIYNDVYVDADAYCICNFCLTDAEGNVLFCAPNEELQCNYYWACTGFMSKMGSNGCLCKCCCNSSSKCAVNENSWVVPGTSTPAVSSGGVIACAIKCLKVFSY